MAYPPSGLPDVLPGEDRSYGAGLFVDLIPETSWFTNVRSAVDPADWDRLRRHVYRRAGHRCEACGAARCRLEAHERFTYDAQTGIQRLVRLVCLCDWCHTATHMGMAGVRGVRTEAIAHLMAVTGMSPAEADEHIGEAFARWERRSAIRWHVDLSVIAAAGIRLREPPGTWPSSRVRWKLVALGRRRRAAGRRLVVATVAAFIPASEPAPVRETSDAEQRARRLVRAVRRPAGRDRGAARRAHPAVATRQPAPTRAAWCPSPRPRPSRPGRRSRIPRPRPRGTAGPSRRQRGRAASRSAGLRR